MKDNGSICLITMAATDFRTCKSYSFSPKWYSHKFKGPGLRYEVGVCIQTGWIVWIHGPIPPGHWPDVNIAHDAIHYEMDCGEKYLADGGYRDAAAGYSETPTGQNNPDQRMKARVQARHETVNRLLKNFGILHRTYRHHKSKHGMVFWAVANLVQANIMLEKTVHQVQYFDNH